MATEKKEHTARAEELVKSLPQGARRKVEIGETKGSSTAIKLKEGGRRIAEVQATASWVRVPTGDAQVAALEAALEAKPKEAAS